MLQRRLMLLAVLTVVAVLSVIPARAQNNIPETPDRGAYLAQSAGCAYCHSPSEGPAFSGGRVERNGLTFYAPNLTPSESGLASWTTDDLRTAITQGITPEGRQLHPVMPYLYYSQMASSDLNALVAYLQSLEPVETESQPPNELSGAPLPPIPARNSTITAPEPTDSVAYGGYLVEAVMVCGSCHTPTRSDGSPDPDLHLAGGLSFTGEWGTVYASNLTPQITSGIGPLQDETIMLAIVAGQHSQHRPIYAMPWQAYSVLTGTDVQSIVDYLRSVEPVLNDVPAAQINPGYEEYPRPQAELPPLPNIALTVLITLLMIGLVGYLSIRQYQHSQRIRNTDWEEHFREVLAQARAKEASRQTERPHNGQENSHEG